jgi:hypothetical protein
MAVRTTVDIPEPLHEQLRRRAERSGTSIRSLIVRALEQTYTEGGKGHRVTGPMLRLRGKNGPRFPVDETPHDLILP